MWDVEKEVLFRVVPFESQPVGKLGDGPDVVLLPQPVRHRVQGIGHQTLSVDVRQVGLEAVERAGQAAATQVWSLS